VVRPDDAQRHTHLVAEGKVHPPPALADHEAARGDRKRVGARAAVLVPAELDDLRAGDPTLATAAAAEKQRDRR
jgi:hypothetical protein